MIIKTESKIHMKTDVDITILKKKHKCKGDYKCNKDYRYRYKYN